MTSHLGEFLVQVVFCDTKFLGLEEQISETTNKSNISSGEDSLGGGEKYVDQDRGKTR